MEPSIGELELGFADVIGEFDALVDTMHDETNGLRILSMEEDLLGGGVVRDLQKHHKCKVYVVSTVRIELSSCCRVDHVPHIPFCLTASYL